MNGENNNIIQMNGVIGKQGPCPPLLSPQPNPKDGDFRPLQEGIFVKDNCRGSYVELTGTGSCIRNAKIRLQIHQNL